MDDIPDDNLRKIIYQFLYEFKILILDKGLYVKNHQKNRDALLELELTENQREEIILSLSMTNYNSGPDKDKYKPGDYWVFGKIINSGEIYIKLKIVEDHGEEYAVCYSFHKSEHPLSYHLAD